MIKVNPEYAQYRPYFKISRYFAYIFYPSRIKAVRDYIHVVDLAKGHVKAIENLKDGVNIYNLGTGTGTSVLELVDAFIKVNNVNVPYKIVGRRPGDLATCFADVSKAEQELGWKAELSIDEMVRDAWKFEQNNN